MKNNANKEFWQKLFKLVLPIAFQQFMLALVSASDAFMLGALSQDAMSAVSLASQITFVENLFFAAMTIGLTMFAAQYWGKGDVETVEKIFAYVMKITLFVSFAVFFVGLFIPEVLMRIFTNEQSLINSGAVYLRTVSLSFFLTGISQIYLCIIKNTGKAYTAGVISSVSVIVNVILNAVLIFGLVCFPEMGIAGAALATVISRIIEVICCVTVISGKSCVKLKFYNIIKKNKLLCREFWKYTTPVLCNEFVWGIGFSMYSVIMGHLGSDAVAANSIANIVKNLVACFTIGLASGGGIIIGNELGTGNSEKAKKYGKKLCGFAVFSGFLSGLLIVLLSPAVCGIADLTDVSKGYLKIMLFISAYNLIGYSVNCITISGIFCSGGDTKFGLCCDAVVMWCITVPLGIIAAFVLKLPVIWVFFILNIDEIIKIPAVYNHYKKYLWVKNLTEHT